MGKIGLIIGREYLTRVKKKTFIIMTILGPILMAAAIIIPSYIAIKSSEKEPATTVGIVDESGFYDDVFVSTDRIEFKYLDSGLAKAKAQAISGEMPYVLYIPEADSGDFPSKAIFYGQENVGEKLKTVVTNIMSNKVKDTKLQQAGIDSELLKSIKTNIDVKSYKIDETGNEKRSYNEISQIIGYIAGLLIYMFIIMFSSQVMRGVMEEKSSRIVEVIVSSVKPFQLMMGKIIGIGLVGLTQFLLWIILTLVLVGAFGSSIIPKETNPIEVVNSVAPAGNEQVTDITQSIASSGVASDILNAVSSVHIGQILLLFLLYFVGGYLLYASIYAAIGGAVDSEDDTQQFMWPVTIIVLIPVVLIANIVNEPSGPIAFWLSIIPFTSPVTMMIRLPFGVPTWQLILSLLLLFGGFVVMTWLSGKIYRTGILMYGKRVTWKEIIKWIKTK
ncbi:MAG: ABC transporter permease [Bacteroidales bacterium]|nr:ABC transporter permease [Bacteroidales bacterium]